MLAPIDCVTHYSLMRGNNRPDRLVAKAAEFGYKAIGICDYDTISSCVQLYKECKKHDIKPIIGIRQNNEIYIAKNLQGWKNLIRLASKKEGEKTGLIQIGGSRSRGVSDYYCEEDVYLGGSHYLNQDDAIDHRVMLCVGHKKTMKTIGEIDGEDSKFLYRDDYYLHSPEEIRSNADSNIIYNTEKIIDSIEDFSIFRKPSLPKISSDTTEDELLKQLCRASWKRFNLSSKSNSQVYLDRVKRELGVIHDAGLEGYFLVVSDYIRWARSQGILVGVSRGSSGGSLVSYLAGITQLDPIEFDLLFERFYNAGRNTKDHISYPDIDTDFPRKCRESVVNYITERYGKDRVMGISTFGRLQGRSALQEVLKIHGSCSKDEANRITKNLPQEDKISDELEEAKEESTLKWVIENNPDLVQDWVTYKNGDFYGEFADQFAQAIRLEGTFKTNSRHASGIIVSGEPIIDIAPIRFSDTADGDVVAMEYGDAELLGILKMDILGLAALDKIMGVENRK